MDAGFPCCFGLFEPVPIVFQRSPCRICGFGRQSAAAHRIPVPGDPEEQRHPFPLWIRPRSVYCLVPNLPGTAGGHRVLLHDKAEPGTQSIRADGVPVPRRAGLSVYGPAFRNGAGDCHPVG